MALVDDIADDIAAIAGDETEFARAVTWNGVSVTALVHDTSETISDREESADAPSVTLCRREMVLPAGAVPAPAVGEVINMDGAVWTVERSGRSPAELNIMLYRYAS